MFLQLITMSYLVFNLLYRHVAFTIVKNTIGLTRPGASVHVSAFKLEHLLRENSIFAGAGYSIFILHFSNVLRVQIIKVVQYLKTLS